MATFLRQVRRAGIPHGPNEEQTFTAAGSSFPTTASTPQVALTLTFTPPSTGDYAIIARCDIHHNHDGATGASTGWCDLYDGTTSIDPFSARQSLSPSDFGNAFFGWMAMHKVNLTATSHSFSIRRWSQESGRTTTVKNMDITALRLDDFRAHYYAETNARETSTSTTYEDKLGLTFTPEAGDHLIIMKANYDNVRNTNPVFGRISDGSSTYDLAELRYTPPISALGPEAIWRPQNCYSFVTLKKLEAVSNTWKFQIRREAGTGTGPVGISAQKILVLQSSGAGMVHIDGGHIDGAQIA